MNSIPNIDLPVASPGALAVGTLGRVFIWAGAAFFLVALLQTLFLPKTRKLGNAAFVLGCVSVFGAFLTLASLFIRNQFEFSYVYEHSEITNPLQYKIAAIWSGQQGSFLLWATTSAIFGLLTIWGTREYRRWFTAAYALFLGCLCGILAYETPFGVLMPHGLAYIPKNGLGLNASLQNYWVVIHPPTIFMGFGSLTVLFAYAVSALISRRYQDWARQVRPWALVSLSLVGIGLCMGGLWAYETLGWGGFWKWDPVENVSFVPWCLTAALVHGLIVQGAKNKWTFTNLLLAGLPFVLYVYGTFLTRAGFLDGVSVHSFAQMQHTAHMVLLTFCIFAAAGFLGLWLWRWLREPRPDEAAVPAQGTYREAWYRIGNTLLVLTGLATAIGMSVPLVQVIMHQKPKVVDEHLYHLVLSWFFIPMMVMMAIAPFVSWRRMSARELGSRILNVFSVTVGLLGLSMLLMRDPNHGIQSVPGATIDFPFRFKVSTLPWITFLYGLCLFVAVANLWRIAELWKRSKPAAGAFIAHIGVATAMAGLIISRGMERVQTYALQEEDISPSLDVNALPYDLSLRDVNESNLWDKNNKLQIDVRDVHGGESFLATPGFYMIQGQDGQPQQFAWPSIHHELSHDSYLALKGRTIPADDPEHLGIGQTKAFKVFDVQNARELTFHVTYRNLVRQGAAGQVGTRFLADLLIDTPNHTKLNVKPAMEVGAGGGPQILPALVDADYFVTLMRMDAADKSVELQFNFVRPLYEVDFYYKPMVILVWFGAGIMTLGGLLSAWYRRRVLQAAQDLEAPRMEAAPAPQKDAPVPATQI